MRSEYEAAPENYKYKWQFIEVSAEDIIVATKRILTTINKGIQTYHSLHADIDGNIKMNVHSCMCLKCISSNWAGEECDNKQYVGNWHDCKPIRDHPIYDDIRPKNPRKRQRVSIESNHNNRE